MKNEFINTELLEELFEKLRFSPNAKAKCVVRGLINDDLQSGESYPDEVAKQIVEFLDLGYEYIPDVVDVLKVLYLQDNR